MYKRILIFLILFTLPILVKASHSGFVFVVNFGFVSKFHNDRSCEKLCELTDACSGRKVVRMSRKKAKGLFLKECKYCKYRH